MTFTIRRRPNPQPIVCVYRCPEHGEFDALVERDDNGDSPDVVPCPLELDLPWHYEGDSEIHTGCGGEVLRFKEGLICRTCDAVDSCGRRSPWTPSPIAGRVRRVEVTRGKWERPERKTYLDTRKLGEGQDIEEFRSERRKMWRDVRMDRARKEFLNK